MDTLIQILLATGLLGIVIGINVFSLIVQILIKKGRLPRFMIRNRERIMELLKQSEIEENEVLSMTKEEVN